MDVILPRPESERLVTRDPDCDATRYSSPERKLSNDVETKFDFAAVEALGLGEECLTGRKAEFLLIRSGDVMDGLVMVGVLLNERQRRQCVADGAMSMPDDVVYDVRTPAGRISGRRSMPETCEITDAARHCCCGC